MKLSTPPPLKPGDTIGVMAPSSRIADADIDAAQAFIEGRGFKVFIHPQTRLRSGSQYTTQYAGTAQEKVDAVHDLARNPDIKAVFFATGGQRALTILDKIDYKLIAANPKIYHGFSDHTVLLNAITAKSGLITYHGPTFKRMPLNTEIDFNLRLLQGLEKSIPLGNARYLKPGTATGILVGGNLSAFRALSESYLPDMKGAILFLEEIKEEYSTIDRHLCAMRLNGLFNKVGAIIFGQFTDLTDTGTPFGMTMEDIIREHTEGLNIPVVMNAPFGHVPGLHTYPIGQTVTLDGSSLILK